jgi:hypothetical protein
MRHRPLVNLEVGDLRALLSLDDGVVADDQRAPVADAPDVDVVARCRWLGQLGLRCLS